MRLNWKHGQIDAGITLALTVPTGTTAGDVVPIGDAGLRGYAITDIATTDRAAVGLTTGQASVRLLPTRGVIEVPVAASGGFSVGDAVYGTQAGTGVVTYAASGDYFVGNVVAVESATSLLVFLGGVEPAPAGGDTEA